MSILALGFPADHVNTVSYNTEHRDVVRGDFSNLQPTIFELGVLLQVNGCTAMHIAAENNQEAFVKVLLAQKAKIGTLSTVGTTILVKMIECHLVGCRSCQ